MMAKTDLATECLSGGRTRRLLIAGLTALMVLLVLSSCSTVPTDISAIAAAEQRAAEAEAQAAAQAARAAEATRRAEEAVAYAKRVEQESAEERASQSDVRRSLDEARERAQAAEAAAQRAQMSAAESEQALESARAEMETLAMRPSDEDVVPRDDFEQAQQRLADLEAELESVGVDGMPEYDVTFRGATEMVLDEQEPISIEVSIPSGEPLPGDAVFRDQVKAVSKAVRATLSGSNFEISYEENFTQSLSAGTAVWDFRVKPLSVGRQTLYATIIQYADEDSGEAPIALRTDSWDVNVTVDPAPQIINAVSRNLGEFAIGIIMFLGGMIAEFLRRRFFRSDS